MYSRSIVCSYYVGCGISFLVLSTQSSFPLVDSLNRALDAIRVSTELIEEELRPHLDVLLTIVQERSEPHKHTPAERCSVISVN